MWEPSIPGLVSSCWILLTVLSVLGLGASTARAADSVLLLSSEEMDWPEGHHAIEVELRASGYVVVERESEAVEPGRLLEQLKGGLAGSIASVTVVKMGQGGMAYVWIPGAKQTYRVTSNEPQSSQAANVLSLRVAELIALRGSGYEVDRELADDTQPESGSKTVSPSSTPAEGQRNWALLGGAGPGLDSGHSRPLTHLYFALQRRVGAHFSLELAGLFSAASARQRFEQGVVGVSERGGWLSLLPDARTRGGLWGQVGPSVGTRCFEFYATSSGGGSSSTTRACGIALGATTRGGYRVGAFSFWVAGRGIVGLSPIRLVSEEQVLATWGRPGASVLLGGGWEF